MPRGKRNKLVRVQKFNAVVGDRVRVIDDSHPFYGSVGEVVSRSRNTIGEWFEGCNSGGLAVVRCGDAPGVGGGM